MKKKIVLLSVALFVSLIVLIFTLKGYRRVTTAGKTYDKKSYSVNVKPAPKKEKIKKDKFSNKAVSFDDITIEEIKEKKEIRRRKSDYDLTPSPEDLIRMKKEKIRAY